MEDSPPRISVLPRASLQRESGDQNDGADGNVTVTAKLIDKEKGFVRDEVSTTIFIPSGETREVSLTLDGDAGREYQHRIEVS